MVKNTGLKLEELDEKAVVYQSVFSQNRGFGLTPKLYIPSTLNIDIILWQTQLNVCA